MLTSSFLQQIPQLKFEWTISIGQLFTIGALVYSARPILKLYKIAIVLYAEHELIKEFICKHEGMNIEDFELAALSRLKTKRREI